MGKKSSGPPMPFFTFKTTFEGTVSFSITKTGDPAIWYMGDGTIYANTNDVTHTYVDGSEKTVSVAVGAFAEVTGLGTFANKQITFFDASSLINLGGLLLMNLNPNLSQFFMPDIHNGNFSFNINFNQTGLESLDFKQIKLSSTRIFVNQCPNLTSVNIANIQSGFLLFNAANSNLTGNITLPNVVYVSSGSNTGIDLRNNPLLTSITFPNNTQIATSINASNCNLTGTLDFGTFTCQTVTLNNNPLLTSILNIKGSADFNCHSCNITGALDMSAKTGSGFLIWFYNNPLLTSVTLGAFSSSTRSIFGYGCDLAQLDMTPCGANVNICAFDFKDNPNLSKVTFFPSARSFVNFAGFVGSRINNFSNTAIDEVVNFENLLNNAWPSDQTATQIIFTNSNLPASMVNLILDSLSQVDKSPYTLLLDGTGNDAPDNNSGGFDGIAAKNDLIAGGVQVTTN